MTILTGQLNYAMIEAMELEMSISDFKAKCLQVIEEVAQRGQSLTITKRGRPLARVVPFESTPVPLRDTWASSVTISGDIVNFDISGDWESAQV